MDPQAVSLVRTTFKAIAAQEGGPEKLASSFYATLFAVYPAAREFFPAAMDTQRERLVNALAYVVDRLEEPDDLLGYLAQLGRDHRKYGVRPHHYSWFADALMRALRNFTGTEVWTEEVDDAWRAALSLISDTMIRAAAAERSPAVWNARVLARHQVLRDLAVLRLQLSEPMRYIPGQYVSVQIPARPGMWRYLSPAIPPNDAGEIEFHVRAVSGGWVSPSIVTHSRPGEVWQLGSPLGDLGIPNNPEHDILMVASGTGIAPMRAQILAMSHRPQRGSEAVAHQRSNPGVHLFIGGKHPCDLYELESLWLLSQSNPWLTVTPITELDDDPWWAADDRTLDSPGIENRRTGQIGKVVAEFADWTHHNVQISGPPAMVQTTRFRLMATGVPADNIRHDPVF